MRKSLRFVAWCEILTGVFMLIDVASGLTAHASALDGILFIALGSLGLGAGIALLRKRGALAWRGSVLLQILLAPVFLLGTVLFRPGLGVFVPVGITFPPGGGAPMFYDFTIGVDFAVSLTAGNHQQYAAVNLVALACLAILVMNRPSARDSA